jgi:hypothetical protein
MSRFCAVASVGIATSIYVVLVAAFAVLFDRLLGDPPIWLVIVGLACAPLGIYLAVRNIREASALLYEHCRAYWLTR